MEILSATLSVLRSNIKFLEGLQAEYYVQPIPQLSNSTIGQHVRHFIEMYQCLIDQSSAKCINYSLRKRDETIQTNLEIAISTIECIITNVQNINLDLELQLQMEKEGNECFNTNFKRELLYNLEHTIHHDAMIKIGLKIIDPTFLIQEEFGVAPSTIQHRKQYSIGS